MLKRLLIENYALIDHLDISFPGELVIITGETGAGKSILLGALSLVLGGRSDVSVLKDPARNCVVEAVFADGEEERIFRRVVTPQGRSRGFIDDEPASVEQLRTEALSRIDVHSQHQHLLLSEREFQRRVLDSYAGLEADVAAHGELYREWAECGKELAETEAQIAASERDRDYLEFLYRQLEEASLREGEMEELEDEQGKLANAETVRQQLSLVSRLFEGEEGSLSTRLKEMAAALDRVAPFYPEFDAFRRRIDSVRIEVDDIRDEVDRRADRIVYSPGRLEEVEARLSQLHGLLRKFDTDSVAGLLTRREEISAQLGTALDGRLKLEQMQKRREELEARCIRSAAALHAARAEAAPRLSAVLQEQVRSLEMPRARFEVTLEPRAQFGPDGSDDIDFLFDANDRGLRPLAKCASGGELSRIMLCIKSLLAQYRGMPTLIFDEVDTGVSGSVAEKMGRVIAAMGAWMQVFAITHLPQVASKGKAHFLVYKEPGPSGMRSAIRQIDGPERQREIARMLSGEDITPEALANAAVLLEGNNSNNN